MVLKVGVIGVGGIAATHVPGWRASEDAELIAGCDIDQQTLKNWGKENQVDKLYSEYANLIADPEIDIVDVCTPSNYHAPLSIAALENNTMEARMRAVIGVALGVLSLTLATVAGAAGSGGKVADKLDHLRQGDLWGEAVFHGDKVRSIKVDSMTTDSVAVIEVLGPLQRRLAKYAITDIRSVRELGAYRIPRQRAPYVESKSPLVALTIEAAIPGGGYLYTGQNKMGMTLFGIAGVLVGTALATNTDAVAGWLPLAVWFKAASMLHLRDEVSAMGAEPARRGLSSTD